MALLTSRLVDVSQFPKGVPDLRGGKEVGFQLCSDEEVASFKLRHGPNLER